MALLSTGWHTLVDLAKLLGPDGQLVPYLVDGLKKATPLIYDMPMVEANGKTYHRFSTATARPAVSWRKINQGITATKGTEEQVDEGMGMLAALAKCDVKLAELSGNVERYRMLKGIQTMRAMGEEMEQTFFYGDSSLNPEEFTGLDPRYNSNALDNVLTAIDFGESEGDYDGDTGDCTSIWGITFGPGSCYGIYPQGSRLGLDHVNYGRDISEAPDGSGELPAFRDWYQFDAGLVVENHLNVVRASLNWPGITDGTIDLHHVFTRMYHRLQDYQFGYDYTLGSMKSGATIEPSGRQSTFFYCSRRLAEELDIQQMDRTNVRYLGSKEWAGEMHLNFRGIPIRRCDQISNTEDPVATP